MTKRKQPYDGTHYNPAVNRMKARRLIAGLDARASFPFRSTAAREEQLLSTTTDARVAVGNLRPTKSSVPPKRHVTASASLANTSRSNCYIVSLLGTRADDFTDAQRMARTLQYFWIVRRPG